MLTLQRFRARRSIDTLHPETALRKEETRSRSFKFDLHVACSSVDGSINGHEHGLET